MRARDPLVIWDDEARMWRVMDDVLGAEADWIAPFANVDDVASLELDARDCVVRVCMLDLPGEERDALNARLPWALRDRCAPRWL